MPKHYNPKTIKILYCSKCNGIMDGLKDRKKQGICWNCITQNQKRFRKPTQEDYDILYTIE